MCQVRLMQYINRISHSNAVVYAHRLRKYGLTEKHHPYIMYICEQPGISQEKLAKHLCVHPSTVTRQLTAMEKRGLILREQDREDHRSHRVYPTDRMKALYPDVTEVMREWNAYLLEELSEQEKEALFSVMEKLVQKAQDAAEKTLRSQELR